MNKVICFFLSFLMLCGSASAASVNLFELAERVDKMEDALKSVQKKLSNNYVGNSKRPALDDDKQDAAFMQMQEVEQTLRQLTGELETIRFKQDEIQARIDQINADMNIRFSDLEKKLIAVEDKAQRMENEQRSAEKAKKMAEKKRKEREQAAARAAKDKEAQMKERYGKMSAKELYDSAFAAIKKQNYKTAQAEFEAFLALYPQHELAGNAQYWLGESYFARSMYQKAAVAFAEGFQKYRQSQKAPDNLFKLGVTMSKMNKKNEACIAFKNFSKEYPQVSESMKRRLDAEVQKLSCP